MKEMEGYLEEFGYRRRNPGGKMMMKKLASAATFFVVLLSWTMVVQAEEIGSVRTKFKVLGANDKIVVEAFDDPDIPGATCYLSRAKTGGISGTIGIAEDTSDASLACRQVGPITLPERIRLGEDDGERVFRKSTSLLFKTLQVVRFYDKKRNTLVYLTYSNKIIDGSPKNAISAIPIMPWQGSLEQ